jgi:uncharacterized membrane protein
LATALALVGSVAFLALAHFTLVDGLAPALGALLSLVPVALLLAWALRRPRHRALALAALALATLGLWLGWGTLERRFPDVFFIEHAGANLILAIVFGRTLLGGREPLCARFARLLHGSIPPEVERYAGQVTVAWTIFFAAMFTLSCALYLGGFLAAWSILANIASPLLIAAMFLAEYAIRCRVLPRWERTGVLGAMRAFSRHFASAQPAHVDAPH